MPRRAKSETSSDFDPNDPDEAQALAMSSRGRKARTHLRAVALQPVSCTGSWCSICAMHCRAQREQAVP